MMPRWKDVGLAAMRLWRVLDWRPVRQQAETPIRLAILGTGAESDRVAELFTSAPERIRGPIDLTIDNPPPDLVILIPRDGAEAALAGRQARDLDERGIASLLLLPLGVVPPATGTPYLTLESQAPETDPRLLQALIDALPEQRRIAAARACPPLRRPLSLRLTQEAAFANAQLALMTNLPSLLPGAGTAAALGADMLVLTTNQIVLVYKLAAVWGENLSNPRLILAEIAPVVGGAFLWRSAARLGVGLVPAFVALAPKVAVAYIGTFVVGGLATVYYERGLRPSDEQVRAIEAEARQALAQAWGRLRPANGEAPNARPSGEPIPEPLGIGPTVPEPFGEPIPEPLGIGPTVPEPSGPPRPDEGQRAP
jgi:uncharacterized protein (DUF697 family)